MVNPKKARRKQGSDSIPNGNIVNQAHISTSATSDNTDSLPDNSELQDHDLIPRFSINELGFEILDLIFSYFSGPKTNLSYHENQQNLLSFCQVSRAFYQVARTHIVRYIPIASTFKARQILSMCEMYEYFPSSLHFLHLIWPDEGKYSTRRTSVITESEHMALLRSFPSMRSLELNCLPYTSISPMDEARFASMDVLANVRSLNLVNTPASVKSNDFQVVPALLANMPKLERLFLLNIALNATEDASARPVPRFKLKSLSICITRPRHIYVPVLDWMLKETIAARSCTSLKLWLSLKCGDQEQDHSIGPSLLKEQELGFEGIETALRDLSPSLTSLSLLGPRTGQASAIISKTSVNLKSLELYDTHGFHPDILHDLPLPTRLEKIAFLPNPSVAYGAPPPPPPAAAGAAALPPTTQAASNGRGRGVMASSAAHGPAAVALAASTGMAGPSSRLRLNANATASSSFASAPNANINVLEDETTSPTTFTEIPVSSQSFIQELGHGGRLEKLKEVVVPDNARFGRRGRWLNKDTIKACRRNVVWITEVPH